MDTMEYHAAYHAPVDSCDGCISRSLNSQRSPLGGNYCWYECAMDGHIVTENDRGCEWYEDEEPDDTAEYNMRGCW